jgi:hypothetical protein
MICVVSEHLLRVARPNHSIAQSLNRHFSLHFFSLRAPAIAARDIFQNVGTAGA